MAVIDDHVGRLLVLADRVGALGESRSWPTDRPEPTDAVRREQLTRLAAAGMTVLKNDGTLPLNRDQHVALIGRHGIETTCMGGGSAAVRAPHTVSIAEGLGEHLGDNLSVLDGVEVRMRARKASPSLVTDPVTGNPGMRLQLWDAAGALIKEEHLDEAFTLVGQDDDLPTPAHRARLTALVPAGDVRIGVLGVGDWSLECGEFAAAPSLRTETADVGEAILRPPGWQTDIVLTEPTQLTGSVELSGVTGLGLVLESTPPPDEEAIRAAVLAGGKSDVAVVVVGLTEEQETEAIDKTTLALPGRQDELVSAVAAASRRTVVVVNAATPVLMPWLDQVDAVIVVGSTRSGGRPRGRCGAAQRDRTCWSPGHELSGGRWRHSSLVGHADRRRPRLLRGSVHRVSRSRRRVGSRTGLLVRPWFGVRRMVVWLGDRQRPHRDRGDHQHVDDRLTRGRAGLLRPHDRRPTDSARWMGGRRGSPRANPPS